MSDTRIIQALQQISSDSNMKVLRYIADKMIANWNSSSSIGSSEWETIKNTIGKEERKRALNLFLEEIERGAHEQNS